MTAAESWRRQLEAWAIPAEILAGADESPYGWPQKPWKERGEKALREEALSPTTQLVHDLAGREGSVLDVGAGTGRASLPLVGRGHRVTMVEPDQTMLATLRELAASLPVEIVAGSWPEAETQVDAHEVAMSAHVVYDVPDLGAFLQALDRKAGRAVVIEMFPEHPWSVLRELYLEFHRLDRPSGPTGDDLVAVVEEFGRLPFVARFTRPSDVFFESMDELVAATGRRLALPRARWPELESSLAPRVVNDSGRLQVAPLEREILTVWWRTADSL